MRCFKRKLNQLSHLKENLLDQFQDQCLGIKYGFIDIASLVTHLGTRSMIGGQEF